MCRPTALQPTETGVFRGEDFFLWQDARRGWFHLLFHVKQPFAFQSAGWKSSGALAWSKDGVHWTPAMSEAYNGTPVWAPASSSNGSSSSWTPGTLTSRQRPLLVFDDPTDLGRPTHLFNGVQNCSQATCGGVFDYSWTAVVPFQ